MQLFPRHSAAKEDAFSVHLRDVSARLDVLTTMLESHFAVTAEHGRRLDLLPNSVVVRAVAEAREVAQMALSAAWVTLRRRVIEEVSKWAWRAVLGFIGIKMLAYLHTMASGLSIQVITP